ncbi:MAG: hypothetical protein EBV06_12275 [Planctomycetia bacterium]|nr:hypothetical protein [Planctomycetia bacterium]
MKKILTSLLAAAFLLTFTVGCGEEKKPTPAPAKDKKDAAKKEEPKKEEPKKEEPKKEDKKEEPKKEEAKKEDKK